MQKLTSPTLTQLRAYAVTRSLCSSPTILDAVQRLGYIQADPIRAPARAQDLILFQRVRDYRIDDLERAYATQPIIEDSIYNYGFFHEEHAKLLYPRALSSHWQPWADRHAALLKSVESLLRDRPHLHPRDAESILNAGRRTNGWGGTSSATTMALETLHRMGRARVSHREKGIRVYAAADYTRHALTPVQRAEGLLHTIVNLYAPMTQRELMPFLRWMSRVRVGVDCVGALERAVQRGEYRREKIDGLVYVWPASEPLAVETRDEVRLLAPFDPVVWDRTRFAHFWGWEYRFEAYTPAVKRVRGYYALPMLWRDQVIGWANARLEGGNLIVEPGLVIDRHPGAAFTRALEAECARFAQFVR